MLSNVVYVIRDVLQSTSDTITDKCEILCYMDGEFIEKLENEWKSAEFDPFALENDLIHEFR